MRGDPHYFTHGRAMMWAAFDQGVRAAEEHGLDGPAEHWRHLRTRLEQKINELGFDDQLATFTQTYDNAEVDASLLQLPHTGFLTYDDPQMLGTVARIERDLRDESGLLHPADASTTLSTTQTPWPAAHPAERLKITSGVFTTNAA